MEQVEEQLEEELEDLNKDQLYRNALDLLFDDFEFSKNKNLTKGSIQVQMTPELFEYRLQETSKAACDPIYFAENFYHIVSPALGKHIIKMYEKQEDLLKTMIKHERVVTLASRQCGKTTSYCIFCCHTVCFSEDKNIVILANKLSTAKEILSRIKLAFELLPKWLKPGVVEWNKELVKFSNGCKIMVFAASSDGPRSQAANCLIIDECVTGDTNITIRNKKTGEIRNINIEDLFLSEYS